MDRVRRIFSWLRAGWNLRARHRDLDAELQFHLEEEAAEREAAGLSPHEAQLAARRDLGNLARVKELTRARWGWSAVESWMEDLRFGTRVLRKDRVFTLAAVASLAMGIGANTAIYSIIRAVILQPLPVKNPHELVAVQIKGGQSGPYFTNPLWEALRDSRDALAGALAYSEERFDVSEGIERQSVPGLWVSGGYFETLGVPALRGRMLSRPDDRRGCGSSGPVAVISESFWRRRFQADPAAVGRVLRLNRTPFTIVGVAPAWMKGFNRDLPFAVAIPIGCEPLLHATSSLETGNWWLQVAGRLKPGAALPETSSRLNAFAPQIFRAAEPQGAQPARAPRNPGFELIPFALGSSWVREGYGAALWALMAIAALVLLLACANIASLLLTRAGARSHELALRRALGATRWRLLRQLITESLLLSGMGACGGFLLALWGGRALVGAISTASSPTEIDLAPDLHLLAVVTALAIVTALAFGLFPSLRASGGALPVGGGRGLVSGARRSGPGKGLVVLQLAASLVLLYAAGLFTGTLRNLTRVDLGFRPDGVLLASIDLQRAAKEAPARAALYNQILTRLRTLPGVAGAAGSRLTPIGDGGWNELAAAGVPGAKSTLMYRNRVSPGYFRTLGVPLVAGRDFNETDVPGAPPAMVIDESAARKLFGSANPLGMTLRSGFGPSPRLYQVVGVVKDAKYGRVDEKPRITAFDALEQAADPFPRELNFELRHTLPAERLTPTVKAALAELSPNLSIEFRSLKAQVDESVGQQRLVAALSTVFGALALALPVMGIYGSTAYATGRRRREIGLRIALGARTWSVLWLMLRGTAGMLAAGTALGALGATAAGRLVTSLLFGMAPNDAAPVLAAALILSAAALLAAFVPAWRAARLAPAIALREQ